MFPLQVLHGGSFFHKVITELNYACIGVASKGPVGIGDLGAPER